MTFWRRIRRSVDARLTDALEQMEDPVALQNHQVLELSRHLDRAREAVATAMAMERRLVRHVEEAEQAAVQWTRRAYRAMEQGAEELAREAVRRKQAAEEMAEAHRYALHGQREAVERLKSSLAFLEQRLQDARVQRARLTAQAEAARAQQVVASTLVRAMGEEAQEEHERAALRIDAVRHRAEATVELTTARSEAAFRLTEQARTVEAELEAIRQQLRRLPDADDPPAIEYDEQAG